MEEAKKNTTANTTTKTTEKKETKTTPRITEEDFARMKGALRRMPERKKTRSVGMAIDDLSSDIFSHLRKGRTVDEIFDALAPYLHCNVDAFERRLHKSFVKSLPEGTDKDTAELKWIDLISGVRPAIDTTATEIKHGDATPKALANESQPSASSASSSTARPASAPAPSTAS